jgi:GxxExxY protein
VELQRRGVQVRRQARYEVVYEGVVVGLYRADIISNDRVLIEVKATGTLTASDERQVLNYLTATPLELGFLLLFGPEPVFRLFLFENDRKIRLERVR